ncbi:hypothetical protein [Sporomusa sp. KB1]|jgi:hypothetical protein|uniref:hypothetical protein n=1 Tax=Sporomusa sp. KB1 TaxID=943346 RepID=UPI0011A068E5|nr:hypothetical protein [Sporomusa sp. KB1]TWH45926.1 hypothetical protein Salpa_1858 [Sporomusa sp. KB1]
MAKRRQNLDSRDCRQLSIFDSDVLEEAAGFDQTINPGQGSLNLRQHVRTSLVETLQHVSVSRQEIADRMSWYTGTEISVHQLNAWTAAAKEHRFPLEYAPAFCRVTGDYRVLEAIAQASGCTVRKSEEVIMLELESELERIDGIRRQLLARKRQMRTYMLYRERDGRCEISGID